MFSWLLWTSTPILRLSIAVSKRRSQPLRQGESIELFRSHPLSQKPLTSGAPSETALSQEFPITPNQKICFSIKAPQSFSAFYFSCRPKMNQTGANVTATLQILPPQLDRGILTAVLAFAGTIGSAALLCTIYSKNSNRTESNVQIRAARQASNITLINQGLTTLFFCAVLLSLQAWTYLEDIPVLRKLQKTSYCSVIGFIYFVGLNGCIYSNTIVAVGRLIIVATSGRQIWLNAKIWTYLTVAFFWWVRPNE